jgi:hypothetical protein
VRPFGPDRHNAVVGENLAGWELQANGMEVINSSATQTNPMQLIRDWMVQLNRGRTITPVGSSDSHDVSRHFVGQGRTYIRCDDRDPGNINIDEAVQNFLAGHVMVSYGLLARIEVNERYGPGDLVPPKDEFRIAIRVLGPHWVSASNVELYANGERIAEWETAPEKSGSLPKGVKWQGDHRLTKPQHDVFLTIVARGPGIAGPHWKTAKPYQPVSADWTPSVLACSGAVWLDVDGDGRRTPAYEYASRLLEESGGNLRKLVQSLERYDAAVASQAAHRFQATGQSLLSAESRAVWTAGAPAVQAGFNAYLEAWRDNQAARSKVQ